MTEIVAHIQIIIANKCTKIS